MYFVARTPIGVFKSVPSDDEVDNEIVRKNLTTSLRKIDSIHFQGEFDGEEGIITVSLGSELIKNSAFIIID